MALSDRDPPPLPSSYQFGSDLDSPWEPGDWAADRDGEEEGGEPSDDLEDPDPPEHPDEPKLPEEFPGEEEIGFDEVFEILRELYEEAMALIERYRASLPPCDIHELPADVEGGLTITHTPTREWPWVEVEVELEDEFQFRWPDGVETLVVSIDDIVGTTPVPITFGFQIYAVARDAAGECEGFPAAVLGSPIGRIPAFTIPAGGVGVRPPPVEVTLTRAAAEAESGIPREDIRGLVVLAGFGGFFAFPLRCQFRVAVRAT